MCVLYYVTTQYATQLKNKIVAITTRSKGKYIFVIYTSTWTSIEILDYDDDFWQIKIASKLENLVLK
jgi:hypothetical protein